MHGALVKNQKNNMQRSKLNRHLGHRFEGMVSIDDYAEQGACTVYDEYSQEAEEIIKIIGEKGIPTAVLKTLSYRLEGYPFKEIALKMGQYEAANSVIMAFARVVKKRGLISALLRFTPASSSM